jgi:5-formyltetrahydrofolate cyclo-ligase
VSGRPAGPAAEDRAAALLAEKARLRASALAARDALAPDYRAAAAGTVADGDLPFAESVAGRVLGGFWPMRSEIDPRPLMSRLNHVAAGLALPLIEASRLRFRLWRLGEGLRPGQFGTSEPHPGATPAEPTALIVPLAAFDRAGGRIGYGRGYYDGYIAAMRARGPLVAIGLAFAAQEVPSVPLEPHDQRLDWIVTERGVWRVASSG